MTVRLGLLLIYVLAAASCTGSDPLAPKVSKEDALQEVARLLCSSDSELFRDRLTAASDSGVWLVFIEDYHFDQNGDNDTFFYVVENEAGEAEISHGTEAAETFLAEETLDCGQ